MLADAMQPQVIALCDADDWLDDAISELRNGNVAAAVHAATVALGFVTEARDGMILALAPDVEEEAA